MAKARARGNPRPVVGMWQSGLGPRADHARSPAGCRGLGTSEYGTLLSFARATAASRARRMRCWRDAGACAARQNPMSSARGGGGRRGTKRWDTPVDGAAKLGRRAWGDRSRWR